MRTMLSVTHFWGASPPRRAKSQLCSRDATPRPISDARNKNPEFARDGDLSNVNGLLVSTIEPFLHEPLMNNNDIRLLRALPGFKDSPTCCPIEHAPSVDKSTRMSHMWVMTRSNILSYLTTSLSCSPQFNTNTLNPI